MCDSADRNEALTRPASRVETLVVIDLQSWAEVGIPSLSITSCNQSSADSVACSGPNNWATALKNADNSRSAIGSWSPQRGLEFLDDLYAGSGFIFLLFQSRKW